MGLGIRVDDGLGFRDWGLGFGVWCSRAFGFKEWKRRWKARFSFRLRVSGLLVLHGSAGKGICPRPRTLRSLLSGDHVGMIVALLSPNFSLALLHLRMKFWVSGVLRLRV